MLRSPSLLSELIVPAVASAILPLALGITGAVAEPIRVISLTIDAIGAVRLLVMTVLYGSLCAAVIIPQVMLGIMTTRMVPIHAVVVTAMPRMPMGAKVAAGLPQPPISLPIEASLNMVAGPVQGMGEFVIPIHRGEQGEPIELQINQRTLLVEAPILSPCSTDLASVAVDIMPDRISFAQVAVVVVTRMAIVGPCAAGEHEPTCEHRADCPILPTALLSGRHFFFLRAVHLMNRSRRVR